MSAKQWRVFVLSLLLCGTTVAATSPLKTSANGRHLVDQNKAPVSDRVLNAGQMLSFTSTASDVDVPPQGLTFSQPSFPTGATLDATSGLFTWRPAVAQADTTNLIKLMVEDDGKPVLSATQSFTVSEPAR